MISFSKIVARILRDLIRFYQAAVSPYLGRRCRFYPSCSEYATLCLEKFSLRKAVVASLRRLSHCHPFHPGGVDLP